MGSHQTLGLLEPWFLDFPGSRTVRSPLLLLVSCPVYIWLPQLRETKTEFHGSHSTGRRVRLYSLVRSGREGLGDGREEARGPLPRVQATWLKALDYTLAARGQHPGHPGDLRDTFKKIHFKNATR